MKSGVRYLRSLAPTLLLNVALPVVTYVALTAAGFSPLVALLAGSVWALGRAVATGIVTRHVDDLSVLALVAAAVAVLAAVAFHDVRVLVVRSAAVTGLFGLAMLVSLLLPRPAMFYVGRRFATDGTSEGVARWDGFERYPAFRRANRVITAVWGATLLGEALVRIALVLWAPLTVSVVVGHVVPTVVILGLVAITTVYGRRVRRASTPSAVSPPTGSGRPDAEPGVGEPAPP